MIMTVSTTDQSITSAGNTSADSNERLLQQIENLDLASSQNNNSHGGTTTSVATADLLDMLEQDMSSKATKRNKNNDGTTYPSSGEDRRPAQRRYSGSSIEGSFTSKLLGGYTDLLDDDDNDTDNGGDDQADTHVAEENSSEEFIIPSIDDSAIKKSTNNYYAASTNSSGKSSSDIEISSSDIEIYATPTKTKDGSLNYQKSNKSPYNSSDNSSKAHHMAPLGKHIILVVLFNLLGRDKTLQ